MSDDKSQQTESETAPAASSDNPANGEAAAEAPAPKREWKPTPKFDHSKVAKTEKKAPKEPEPDILVITNPSAEADFPYGVAAVMALLLLVAVYTATATGHGGHGEAHGDAHGAHGAVHESPPTAGVAHAATNTDTDTDTKEAAAPVRAAPKPRPRADTRARVEQPAHPRPAPAAGEIKAEPKPEPKPEQAEPPKAEPPKAEPEPPKPKPAASGGLAQAQTDYDDRKWFAAYRAAKDVYKDTKSEDALALMGLAACRTKKQDKVKYVLKRLSGSAVDDMKQLCKELGVPTK